MKSKQWLNRQKKDPFVIKAQQKGLLSRSAFKLIEIENKFKIINNTNNIIEFGASPGGWSQVIVEFNSRAKITAKIMVINLILLEIFLLDVLANQLSNK